MGLPLRPQTLNVTWWYLYFPYCVEGAEDTFSFLLMYCYCWVLLYCVFSSFPQKLWQVLCALGVFEWCGVTIIQKILWWCDIPSADTAQAVLCVTREEWPSLSGADIPSVGLCVGLWGRDSALHSSAGGTPVLLKAKAVIQQWEGPEGYVLFVRMCAWMCLTQGPGDTSTTVYWRKQY